MCFSTHSNFVDMFNDLVCHFMSCPALPAACLFPFRLYLRNMVYTQGYTHISLSLSISMYPYLYLYPFIPPVHFFGDSENRYISRDDVR